MLRRLCHSGAVAATASVRHKYNMPLGIRFDERGSGVHDLAPRDGEDFVYEGPNHVLPGAHPLPLQRPLNSETHPLVSPYMPSPHRTHPYFTAPVPELPHFDASVPIVYTLGTIKERIVVPVYSTGKSGGDDGSSKNAAAAPAGSVSHTRELDPFVFGLYPHAPMLGRNVVYWEVRAQNYASRWDFEVREIFRKAKKNWANTGLGLPRTSNRKQHNYHHGGHTKPAKPWNALMPTMHPTVWHTSNRMMLALKLLQGKLMVVDRLTLPEPTEEAFFALCREMQWDVRHTGGGVLFMDGGSRLCPSVEFDRSFFYGSFANARCKLVRPTIQCDAPYDWNRTAAKRFTGMPKGPKNPIPINRFNCYDALQHHLLVVTEGAVMQLEQEMMDVKLSLLPPHVLNQMPDFGAIHGDDDSASMLVADGGLLGDAVPVARGLDPIEFEAARRTEEAEAPMYEGFADNPYRPWGDDEARASYSVDAVDGVIRRHVDGKKASWSMLT